MTEKIYDYKGDTFEFEATVEKCEKNNAGQFEIVLDKTAFFCGGGGQERDFGEINLYEVIELYEKDGEIYHVVSSYIPVGEKVFCKIDKEKRFRNMQLHSGEHLVSGIIHKLYGYNNVGFHLGKDFVTMDVDGILKKDDLRKIEILVNKAIWENVPFKVYYPKNEELSKLDYRSKLELTENVRIVEIEGYDKCACCAPHVSFSGQIGIVKLLDVTHIKKGSRIRMLSGSLAFFDYEKKYELADNISTLLSSKHEDIFSSVEKIKSALEAKEYECKGLKRKLLEVKYGDIKEKNNVMVFDNDGDTGELVFLLNLLKKENEGMVGVFFGNDENGYNFVLESNSLDLSSVKTAFLEELGGRCGGKSNHIQGFLKASEKSIEKIFENKNVDIFIKR